MGTENEMDELFDKAIRLEKRGAWEQAISLYEQAVDKWGDQPEAVYARNSAARLREMQNNSYQPPEPSQNEDARWTIAGGKTAPRRGIGGSIGGALAVLAWDVVFTGWFGMSFCVCPIWFLYSMLKNAIQRPGWRLALLRIAIPPVTLGLVLANEAVQYRIGKANAPRIIAACEEFHAVNGRYPKALDELVPGYLPSIPRAKYCLQFGEFVYWNEGSPALMWYVAPPCGRKIYNFGTGRWSYLD